MRSWNVFSAVTLSGTPTRFMTCRWPRQRNSIVRSVDNYPMRHNQRVRGAGTNRRPGAWVAGEPAQSPSVPKPGTKTVRDLHRTHPPTRLGSLPIPEDPDRSKGYVRQAYQFVVWARASGPEGLSDPEV